MLTQFLGVFSVDPQTQWILLQSRGGRCCRTEKEIMARGITTCSKRTYQALDRIRGIPQHHDCSLYKLGSSTTRAIAEASHSIIAS